MAVAGPGLTRGYLDEARELALGRSLEGFPVSVGQSTNALRMTSELRSGWGANIRNLAVTHYSAEDAVALVWPARRKERRTLSPKRARPATCARGQRPAASAHDADL